jgi:hypothetical protein
MFAALVITTASIAGCGSSDGFARVPVEGYVHVDGQPLAQGVIRFVPDKSVAGPSVQAAIENGVYQLDHRSGPIAGKHRVEIEATGHLGLAIDDEMAYARQMQTRGALPVNPIPPQFNRQSQLAADIPAEGTQALHFDLNVKGGIR